MNPALLLPTALAIFATGASMPSSLNPIPEGLGGGALKLGSESFQFAFDSLNLAPAQPKLKLPRAFVLRGRLIPASGVALTFELTAMEDGRIYGLRLVRKHPQAADDDRWSATLKTKIEVLQLDARPGGKLRISLEGPLATMEGSKGGTTTWKGELWGTFREVPL